MASLDESHYSYDSTQSEDGNYSKTLTADGGDNQLTNADSQCMYGDSYDSRDDIPPLNGQLNREVDVYADNYEQYKVQVEHMKRQYEKDKAEMTGTFEKERISLQESLEKEHHIVTVLTTELSDVKNELEEKNIQNLEAAKKQFDAQLQIQLQSNVLEHERLDHEHRAELDALKARHQDDIRAIRTSHQDEIRALKGDADDLKQMLRTAKEKTSEATEEMTRALARETELIERLQKTDAEVTRANNELAELKMKYEAFLSRPRDEDQHDQGERRLHERISKLEQKTEEGLDGTYALLNQLAGSRPATLSDANPTGIREMHNQYVQKMKKRWKEKESQYENHIEELNLALEEAKTKRYAELDDNYLQVLDQKEKENVEMAKKLATQSEVHFREKEVIHGERKRLQCELDKSKTKLNDMHGRLREKEVLCVQHEATISDLKKNLKQASDDAKLMIQQNAVDQRDAERRHRVELEERLKKLEADVRTEMETRAEADRSVHGAQIEDIKRAKEEELGQVKNAHDKLVTRLEGELRKQQEASDRLDREQEERRKEMTFRMENEKSKLETDIVKMQEELVKLNDDHNAHLDEMKRQIKDLNEKLSDEKLRHDQDMRQETVNSEQKRIDAENALSDTISEKEKIISELKSEILALKTRIPPDESCKKKNKVRNPFKRNGKGTCLSPEGHEGYQQI